MTPELTEGPYYLDLNLVRSDITEGHAGAPLALTLAVLNVADGKPIPGATVDIWHADALGVYSGFVASSQGGPPVGAGGGKGDGTTFCRGTQLTDSSGNVTFKTVYAGWYQGRAVHMHIKVHVGGKQIHTGQIFFDDNLTDEVYGTTAPYATRGLRDLLNSDDAIFNQGGAATVITPKQSSTGYAASLAMGVQAA